MAEVELTSSHSPWRPLPQTVDWTAVGDGSTYSDVSGTAARGEDGGRRADYRRAIEYSLNTLVSYVETYGDDDLVLVVVGDHQPPVVTPTGAGRDVPISIIARDPTVLDRTSAWGWQDGMRPGPAAPSRPMSGFRDSFFAAFGS